MKLNFFERKYIEANNYLGFNHLNGANQSATDIINSLSLFDIFLAFIGAICLLIKNETRQSAQTKKN